MVIWLRRLVSTDLLSSFLRVRDQRLKELTTNSCTSLKLEQRYSCHLQMRLPIKNWGGLSITFKHESRDNANMFVCTLFAQITQQIYLTGLQFNKLQPLPNHVRAVTSPSSPLNLNNAVVRLVKLHGFKLNFCCCAKGLRVNLRVRSCVSPLPAPIFFLGSE